MTTQSAESSCCPRRLYAFAALALSFCVSPLALAKPGGEPLVLDTQTGIHSGAGGTILQTGPMGGPGMVPMATLPQLSPQDPTTVVVSPYVEYSGGQTSGAGVQPVRPGQPGQPGQTIGGGGGHHGYSPPQGARLHPPLYPQTYPQAPGQSGYAGTNSSTRWNGATRSGNAGGQSYRAGTSGNAAIAAQTGAQAGSQVRGQGSAQTGAQTRSLNRSTDPAQRANSRPANVSISTQDAGHGDAHSAAGVITTSAP